MQTSLESVEFVQTSPEARPQDRRDSESVRDKVQVVEPVSWLTWAAPRVVTTILLTVLLAWIYQAEGGIGSSFLHVFGLHALLMWLFLVLTQEALLMFSVPISEPFLRLCPTVGMWMKSRAFHVTLHCTGLLCVIGGLVAIAEYKALSPSPIDFPFYTMYSPHSWLAVCLLGLWLMQFTSSAVQAYLYQGGRRGFYPTWARAHRFLGFVIYGVALATCALGFQDMQSSDLSGSVPPYVSVANFTQDDFDQMGYYPNSTLAQLACAAVMLLMLQGITTFFAIAKPN